MWGHSMRLFQCFRRAVVCASLAAVSAVAVAEDVHGRPQSDASALTTITGCVNGTALKNARVDLDTAAANVPLSEIYRLTGSKAIRRQIKQAKNALVEITGRLKEGPKPLTLGTSVGGANIGIGVPAGSASSPNQQMPSVPVVEVETLKVLAESCRAEPERR
jgi:hypothetical protein